MSAPLSLNATVALATRVAQIAGDVVALARYLPDVGAALAWHQIELRAGDPLDAMLTEGATADVKAMAEILAEIAPRLVAIQRAGRIREGLDPETGEALRAGGVN